MSDGKIYRVVLPTAMGRKINMYQSCNIEEIFDYIAGIHWGGGYIENLGLEIDNGN